MRRVCALLLALCACLLLTGVCDRPQRRALFLWQRRGEDGRTEVPDLLFFRGETDVYSQQMTPLNRELAKEGHKIRTFEVWYNARNTELMQHLDMGRCGGVPFYFNKRTRKYICGATTLENLERWANDKPSDPFLPPPDLEKPEAPPNEQHEMVKGWLEEKRAEIDKRTAGFRMNVRNKADDLKNRYEKFQGGKDQ